MKAHVFFGLFISILIFGCIGQIENQAANDSYQNESNQSMTTQNNSNSSGIGDLGIETKSNSTSTSIDYNFSEAYNSEGKPIIWYFYSNYSCNPCNETEPLITGLKKSYGDSVDWREYDVQNATQGVVYWAMTKERKTPGCLCKIPAALLNNTLLIGPVEINKSLEHIVSGMVASASTGEYNFSPVYSESGKLIVYFFYSTGCPSCKAIFPEIESIGKKYENSTDWRGFDIGQSEGKDCYLQFYKEYNISQSRSGVPQIMVNRTILWGRYEINDTLEKMINRSILHQEDAAPS